MNARALKTGIVRGDIFLRHIPGEGCPETPERLCAIYAMLDDPDMQDAFVDVLTQKAEKEDVLLFHTPGIMKKLLKPGERRSLH